MFAMQGKQIETVDTKNQFADMSPEWQRDFQ